MTKLYGSVVNRIMECGRYPTPTVGMGVTFTHWSDRTPGTIVAIRERNGKLYEIDTVGDDPGRNLAVWPDQRYEITPTVMPDTFCGNPATCQGERLCVHHGAEIPPVSTWRMDRAGRLRRTRINENGRRVFTDNGGIVLGSRDYYQDPSF